jgi:TusA-related sulfurtransferase
MDDVVIERQLTVVGQNVLDALKARDFDRIRSSFHPQVEFKALVPRGIREGANPEEATAWLQQWFGDADEYEVLASSVDQVVDRLHIAYRIQLRKPAGWRVIEQQAYCTLQEGLINTMRVLCSGFRPIDEDRDAADHSITQPIVCAVPAAPIGQTTFQASAFYDAGTRGCADGPLDDIASLMRHLSAGQILEVRATDPSVAKDLPAWCRMTGHIYLRQEGDCFLIRHK